MLKNSLKISSQGYPVFLKLVDFIVINVVLIFREGANKSLI